MGFARAMFNCHGVLPICVIEKDIPAVWDRFSLAERRVPLSLLGALGVSIAKLQGCALKSFYNLCNLIYIIYIYN